MGEPPWRGIRNNNFAFENCYVFMSNTLIPELGLIFHHSYGEHSLFWFLLNELISTTLDTVLVCSLALQISL